MHNGPERFSALLQPMCEREKYVSERDADSVRLPLRHAVAPIKFEHFHCSCVNYPTTMKTVAIVPVTEDDCIICLSNEIRTKPYAFSCGCSVKAHLSCIQKWLEKPENGCIYCRKPTQLLQREPVLQLNEQQAPRPPPQTGKLSLKSTIKLAIPCLAVIVAMVIMIILL